VTRFRSLLVAAGFVGAVVLSACGDDGPNSSSVVTAGDLDGRTFVATEFTGHPIVDGSEILISFEGERISI